MRDNSDNGAVVVAIVAALLLLFVLGLGGGIFYFARSQQLAAKAQERARMAEAEAIEQALERSRELDAMPTPATNDVPKEVRPEAVRAAVEAVLRDQERAWNDGDLAAFMEHYWKSDELTFSSGGDTTRGWSATMKRYQARYPTRDRMGRLTLSEFETTPLGDSAALILGRWRVERESEPLFGNFTVVLRKLDDRWVVVHDHTSRKPD